MQVNTSTHLKALAEIYTIHSFAQLSNLNFCKTFANDLLIFAKRLPNFTEMLLLSTKINFSELWPNFNEPSVEFCQNPVQGVAANYSFIAAGIMGDTAAIPDVHQFLR